VRVAVLCPTKARPELFARLVQKVQETTEGRVTVLAYREDSDPIGYPDLPNVRIRAGNLWTVNQAMNALVNENRDFDLYGMIPDDAYPTIPDWDLYLAEVMDPTKARALMTPHDGEWADMAFVTKPWINAVGYYAANFAAHYVWPTVIDILAESTGKRIEPDRNRIMVHHDHVAGGSLSLHQDAEAFLQWCGYTRPAVIARLRGLP
jgi:hypothetical protein